MSNACKRCEAAQAELTAARDRTRQLEAESEALRSQLREALKLVELMRADLERYRASYERMPPNTPERVPLSQLQLGFERVLEALQHMPEAQAFEANSLAATPESQTPKPPPRKESRPHGRRRLDLSTLPVERVEIDPDEVVAAGGEGFEKIGEEISERVAFRPGGYVRLRIVRTKWARTSDKSDAIVPYRPAVAVAPLPESVWPLLMADPSAIGAGIIAKYDDCLPLHRQERITTRHGFTVPRSTQCGWFAAAYQIVYRIVDAMFVEAKAIAFCIATDASGAPVRAAGGCEPWHVFVFIADRDHVIFRYTEEHTSEAVKRLLSGYRGHLLADAAPVFDALYRGGEIIEVACWFHLRRYFWRAIASEADRALEALSLIAKLFEADRATRELALAERTTARATAAKPVLSLFDAWIERHRDRVDPRGPLHAAIGYYDNQRDALHRFLADGRLRLDNSGSEQQLRNLVLGRHNWMFFENETGLQWYTVFRSLIASCRLHGLNSEEYLEKLLRLAPHWPVTRLLELSPKYWKATLGRLDVRHREMLERPWERRWPTVASTAPPQSAAA